MLNSKIIRWKKIQSSYIIYVDFKSILVLENNGNQNLHESKYQKHAACTSGYNLVCVGDKFIMPFKSYVGEDAV